ncbi:hypothetical protein [Bordetella genomosp. 8]|nr:hypothetical protein [Bordetella genomosp. 8]
MIDNFGWAARRQLTKAVQNADQAEMAALIESVVSTTVGVLDERIAEAFEDDIDDAVEDPLRAQVDRDFQLEELMGETLEEIERRIHWLGDMYPFSLEGNTLKYSASTTGVYEYCLAISQAPSITAHPYVELVRYFEVLAADSVRAFLGDDADFLRTGAPTIEHPKSSAGFEDGMRRLNASTGEWVWHPQPEALPDLEHVKDEGLDFVVWKRLDERSGALFVVGQCACGDTDWHEKDQDIDSALVRIRRWLSRLSFVPPIRAFAVPFPISATAVFSSLTDRAGLTLDRLRLTRIAENANHRDYFSHTHGAALGRMTQIVLEAKR